MAGEEKSPEPPKPSQWLDGADPDCFLCRAAADYSDPAAARRDNLVLTVGAETVTLLNRFPYTNGHLLISPLRHVGALEDLTNAEHLEAMQTLSHYVRQLGETIKAQGFNIGLNLGQIAGAGVPGHLHWHLVPRWPGDNNFMPTLAGVRMIPQSLEALWEALVEKSPNQS